MEPSIVIPIQAMNLAPLKILESFEETMDKLFDEKPYLLDYAKAIDAKSTVTFDHSVKVALMTYSELSEDSEFNEEDIEKYTAAAFTHDVGKLSTPDEILHAGKEINLALEKFNNNESKLAILMRHSIDGINIAKQYGFSKEECAACISHHVKDISLEAGVEGDFKDATNSRKDWITSFGEGYVESLLKENLSWVDDKDIRALETISFSDVVEALRDNTRQYKDSKSWEMTAMICGFDTDNKRMNPRYIDIVSSEEYQKETDFFMLSGSPQRMRELIAEKLQGRESSYVLSTTKVDEILHNPELGAMFVKNIEGSANIDLGNGQIMDIGKKEVLSYKDSSVKPVENNLNSNALLLETNDTQYLDIGELE